MSALLHIARADDGCPLDFFGRRIEPGTRVAVTALGYGARLWMTQGSAKVLSVGAKRAELEFTSASGTYRVHLSALTVVVQGQPVSP